MNVTVFGASGAIGQLVVGELQRNGHTVTAHVRNPPKVPASWGDSVRVVVGNMTEAAPIDDAVGGADAVVSALGPVMDKAATGLPLIEGAQLIVEAMNRHGVTRYLDSGTPSVRDVRDRVGFKVCAIGWIAHTFLPRAYQEMLGMSSAIQNSTLHWTIVRFTAPNNGPRKGLIKAGFFGRNRIGMRISRADIALFTAAQVDSSRYSQAAPAISN